MIKTQVAVALLVLEIGVGVYNRYFKSVPTTYLVLSM